MFYKTNRPTLHATECSCHFSQIAPCTLCDTYHSVVFEINKLLNIYKHITLLLTCIKNNMSGISTSLRIIIKFIQSVLCNGMYTIFMFFFSIIVCYSFHKLLLYFLIDNFVTLLKSSLDPLKRTSVCGSQTWELLTWAFPRA